MPAKTGTCALFFTATSSVQQDLISTKLRGRYPLN
jgi:hypothetical protein